MLPHSNSNGSVRVRRKKLQRRFGFENVDISNKPSNSRIHKIFVEFCERSTFHGMKHIMIDQKRHWIERAFWIVAIAASSIACFFSIYYVWVQWQKYPVVIDSEPELRPIFDIAFPAVTICPYIITAAHKFNYTDAYRLLYKLDGNDSRDPTAYELKMLKLVRPFCFDGLSANATEPFSNEYLDDDFWDAITRAAPKFTETFIYCKIFGYWKGCDQFFFPQLTERGLCYTFNALNIREMFTNEVSIDMRNMTTSNHSSNWDAFNGYHTSYDQRNNDSYPYFSFGDRIRSSLTVVLKVLTADLDFLCSGGTQGFAVSLHPPNERPQVYKRYYYIPLQQSVILRVSPNIMDAESSVLAHDLNVRKCYLRAEHPLQFYNQYTRQNCRRECLSRITLDRCGCVKFFMLRSNGTKICGPGKMKCCSKIDNTASREDAVRSCDCVHPCKRCQYASVQTTQADYYYYKRFDSRPNFKQQLDMETDRVYSRLIVKFKEDKVRVYRLVDALTFAQFYTKMGGICSLFMGASLISFVELLYYLTLRIFFTYRNNS